METTWEYPSLCTTIVHKQCTACACKLFLLSGVPEGLVCPQWGGSGVPPPPPPPPLTFVFVIVILTIQGSGPCKYQASPSCPFDELWRIAR